MGQRGFQRGGAWSGLVCLMFFFGAFFAGGFIPPISPMATAEQVARHYQEHTVGIRFTSVFLVMAGMFFLPYTGVISGQIRRIPTVSPAVGYTQLAAGAANSLGLIVAGMMFAIAAFRPERAPEITQQLNDMAWIITIMPFPPFVAQYVAFGFTIASDPRERPLFPRWLAYLNFWAPLVYASAIVVPFVKTGPLAWSGLITFWVAGVVFSANFIANVHLLKRAIDDETDPAAGRSDGRPDTPAALMAGPDA